MPSKDLTLRMHWHIPLKREWARYGGDGVPIVEKEGGAVVCVVQRRRSFPYTLATARAIVRANNLAVTAARKKTDEKSSS